MSNTVVLHTDVAVIPEVNGSVCIITRCLQNTPISCTGPRHRCTLKLESESYLDAALAHSLSVSIPARLPVQLCSFHPIRGCQNASSHDDDIRGFAVDNFLWSGVLLAQQISCKGGGRPREGKIGLEETDTDFGRSAIAGAALVSCTTAPPCVRNESWHHKEAKSGVQGCLRCSLA